MIRKTFNAVALGRGLLTIRQLVIVPLLIYFWGVEYYGKWLVITAVPSFISLSNLGVGTAASAAISLRFARHSDIHRVSKIFTSGFVMLLSIGVIATLVSILVCSYFSTEISEKSPNLQVVSILVAALFIRMISQPIHGWWIGSGRGSTSFQLNNLYAVGELLVSVIVPVVGGKASALAWGIFILAVSHTFFVILMANRSGCDFKVIGNSRPKFRLMRFLLIKGLGYQFGSVWQAFYYQGSLILAGTILGPQGAALWGSTRTFIRSGNQLLEIISQSLEPSLQVAIGQRNWTRVQELNAHGVVLSLTASVVMGGLLFLLGPTIFEIWTQSKFEVPIQVWGFLAVGLIPSSIWTISCQVQRAANQPLRANSVGLLAACVSFLIMVLFREYGIVSFALGSLAFDILMMNLLFGYTLSITKDTKKELFNRIVAIASPIKLITQVKLWRKKN